jgi:hypothetical protein
MASVAWAGLSGGSRKRHFACLSVGIALAVMSLPAEGETRTLSGAIALTEPTTLSADDVTIESGTQIATNGNFLSITAAKTLTLGSEVRITSFTAETLRPKGSHGRAAGTILITAGSITGGRLFIANDGEPGMAGAPGEPGARGPLGPKGSERDWNIINGCIGGSNGKPGGQGADGKAGQNGGNGGAGGTVVLNLGTGFWNGAQPRIIVSTKGGDGGPGGAGGAGGTGGPGGQGGNGTITCGGTSAGPQGPAGRPGPSGMDGLRGRNGDIVDVTAVTKRPVIP